MTFENKKTTTTFDFKEPATVISLDFTGSREGGGQEPTHFTCDCDSCRVTPKEPVPEAA